MHSYIYVDVADKDFGFFVANRCGISRGFELQTLNLGKHGGSTRQQ